jgi:type IV secretion system protein VirB8
MKDAGALEVYFAEAASWDADRAEQGRRALRLLALTGGAGWLCAIASSLALALAMPLKRVEPFVIRVDNSTGLIDVVPVFQGAASMPQAVTRYFLDHYVTICERFNFATAESDYQECGAFHTAAMNQAWYQKWIKTNAASPLNLYRDGSSVRAQVISVSFFTRSSGVSDLAQVRYIKALRPAGGGEDQVTHWIASIQYGYGAAPKDPKVRLYNPLGFKILDFRTEPEVLPEAPSTSAPRTTGASGTAVGNAP